MVASEQHPLKTNVDQIPSDTSLSEDRGWHDMDVKWLMTKENMGSTKTVVGRTFFRRGASTPCTSTRTRRSGSTC